MNIVDSLHILEDKGDYLNVFGNVVSKNTIKGITNLSLNTNKGWIDNTYTPAVFRLLLEHSILNFEVTFLFESTYDFGTDYVVERYNVLKEMITTIISKEENIIMHQLTGISVDFKGIEDTFTQMGIYKSLPTHKKEHIKDTPKRIVKAWMEYTHNIGKHPKDPTLFTANTNQMVVYQGMEFSSMCSHHFFPFSGICHVAYVPDKHIVGISKIPRTVEFYSRQPQVQEELCQEICDFLFEKIKPLFVLVFMSAAHSCCKDRGARSNGQMKTTAIKAIKNMDKDTFRSYKEEAFDTFNMR